MKKSTEETPDLAQPDGKNKGNNTNFGLDEALLASKIDILNGISLIKSKIETILFKEGNEKLSEILDLSSSCVNLSEAYKNLCMFVEEGDSDTDLDVIEVPSSAKIDISKGKNGKKKGK